MDSVLGELGDGGISVIGSLAMYGAMPLVASTSVFKQWSHLPLLVSDFPWSEHL